MAAGAKGKKTLGEELVEMANAKDDFYNLLEHVEGHLKGAAKRGEFQHRVQVDVVSAYAKNNELQFIEDLREHFKPLGVRVIGPSGPGDDLVTFEWGPTATAEGETDTDSCENSTKEFVSTKKYTDGKESVTQEPVNEACKNPYNKRQSALNMKLAYCASAGQLFNMRFVKEEGANDFNTAMVCAALNGHTGAMRILKEWGATNIFEAYLCADFGGHASALRLTCEEWKAES
jgi:hypothetical protein